jgi:cell division initiation protein
MAISGSMIRKQTFRKKLQGIDQAEVANFLEEVAADIDRLAAENANLTRKTAELETQLKDYRSVEKALQQTLLQGQETTARSIEQARREAQLIIQDAEVKGAGIVEKSKSDLGALKEQISILSARRDSLVSRLKMLLTSELDMVNTLEAGEEAADPAGSAGQDGRAGIAGTAPGADRSALPDDIDDIVKSLDEQ